MIGICLICKDRKDLTEHHVKEMERKPDGKYQTVAICDDCHVFHEKYVNALKTLGYEPDKLKITQMD